MAVAVKPQVKRLKTLPPTVKGLVKVNDTLKIDSSNITTRTFSAVALNKYHNDPDFTYQTDKMAGLSVWDRFWIWFWDWIARLFGNRQPATRPTFPFVKYLIEGCAIVLLIFIIIKIAGLNIANIFRGESKEIAIPYSESLENIHQITFEEEIEKALAQRNYRLAIRLLYLSTLKQLNDAHLINWQIEKTNSAYLNELTDAGQRQSFSVLTRQFEYVWYGDFPVDGSSFQNINTLFHDFKNMLK